MRTNKKVTIFSYVISVISLLFAIYYACKCKESFFFDLSMGIFSGAFLSFIVAFIGYCNDKRVLIFECINILSNIRNKFARFRLYNDSTALACLTALKEIFDADKVYLGFKIHDFDTFFQKDYVIFRKSYDYIVNLEKEVWSNLVSAIAMIESDSKGDFAKETYAKIEKQIIKLLPYEDGNGQHGYNISVKFIENNISELFEIHNRKHHFLINLKKLLKKIGGIMRKNVFWVVFTLITTNSSYFIIDYFNIPTILGFNASKINWDIATLIVGNTIVVGLYLLTYLIVNKTQVKKEKNKKKLAETLLLDTYNQCQESISLLKDKNCRDITVTHCDFSKPVFEDVVMQQQINYPFANKDTIFDYAKEGIISNEAFKDFLDVQKLFRKYVITRLTFFDNDSLVVESEKAIESKLSQAKAKVNGDDIL